VGEGVSDVELLTGVVAVVIVGLGSIAPSPQATSRRARLTSADTRMVITGPEPVEGADIESTEMCSWL
jgi:hypothetical protein